MSDGPFIEIGPGFWNMRSSFFYAGWINVGTHMSLLKLNSGKFLAIDTCEINPSAKAQIDQLTDNGRLLEAVLATHPFHTIWFPAFHKLYPNALYYGTPRHIRNQTSIPWTGSIAESDMLKRWDNEGVYMKIPYGAEFANPAEDNHFSAVMVYHEASRTIHDDDTIMFFGNSTSCILSCFTRPGTMEFWNLEKGLLPEHDAPMRFKAWVEEVIREWDFDNICVAHTSNKIGGAKLQLQLILDSAVPKLEELSKRNAVVAQPDLTSG